MAQNNYKFQSLESLRAFMAWWVVIGHAIQLSGFVTIKDVRQYFDSSEVFLIKFLIKIVDILLHVESAVNVFIILSGFVITHLLLVKKEPYLHFLSRRFFRLAPALYFCLFLAIIFSNYYEIAYTKLSISGDTSMRLSRILEQENNYFIHLFNHLTLTHSLYPQEIFPYSPTTFLAPAWSIGLEWQFYLIAPFLILLINHSQKTAIFVSILFVLIRYLINYQSNIHWQYNSFFFKVPDYFLVGIFTRLILERLKNNKTIIDIGIITGGLLLLQDTYSSVIWIFVIGVILYESGKFKFNSKLIKGLFHILFFNNVITTLGKWSYSTYLVHIPIFSLVIGGYVSISNDYDISKTMVFTLLALSFPFIALISALMYRVIEQPAMNFISAKLKTSKRLS